MGKVQDLHEALKWSQCPNCATLRADYDESILALADVVIERDALRARCEAAEKALCGAREATNNSDWSAVVAALSSAFPCPHEEEAKRLREAIDNAPRWAMREVDSDDDPLYDGMETNEDGDWINRAELRRRAAGDVDKDDDYGPELGGDS